VSVSSTKTVVIAAIVVLAAFVAGVCAGIFADRVLMHRGPHPPRFASRMMMERLDRHLDLTDAQRAKIEQIIERHHRSIGTELAAANAEIERVLTPEQRQKFAKMRMHVRRRGSR
jgi:Spy/CpxP family protein refolding chaperone